MFFYTTTFEFLRSLMFHGGQNFFLVFLGVGSGSRTSGSSRGLVHNNPGTISTVSSPKWYGSENKSIEFKLDDVAEVGWGWELLAEGWSGLGFNGILTDALSESLPLSWALRSPPKGTSGVLLSRRCRLPNRIMGVCP
jgi:hypothetical protein